MTTALEQLLRIAHTGTECVLISDCYDLTADSETLLFQLSRHNQVTLFWIIDRLEQHFPRMDHFSISDGRQKTLLSINKSAQERYHRHFLDKQQAIQARCQRSGVTLIPAITTLPPVSLLRPASPGTRKRSGRSPSP